MIISLVYAVGGNPGTTSSTSGFGDWSFIIMMVVIFAIFYFFMIRPQQKRQKEHTQMLQALKKGDRVITTAGIHGTIVEIDDKTFVLQVSDNTKITFDRQAIAGKLQ